MTLLAFALRVLLALAFVYLIILALLYAFQTRLIYPAPQDVAPLTPGYQEVQLRTSDGLKLRAFYREAAEGSPTVLYFHGNGGTLAGASVSNAALIEAGIGALLVEYRGYGGNPGAPSEAGFYRDGQAALDLLTARGVKPDELVIVGNSIGSGVATEMAVRQSPLALILIAPFMSLRDAAQEAAWWTPARFLLRDHYDNAGKLDKLNMPVLIQHGDADRVIADSHGKTLAGIGRAAEFQAFAQSGHALSFERRSQEARRDWIFGLMQQR